MAEEQVEQKSTEESLVTFAEKGPKLKDALRNLQERTNLINSTDEEKAERSFTERQGLENLLSFVDTTIATASANDDKEMEETARLFKENLVFVGENELKKATQGIAQHLVEVAQKGKDVLFFWANSRSERYITLRVLEELDYLTEESPDLRNRFKLSNGPQETAKECKDLLGNCLVAILDDFVVSGSRMTGFASTIFNNLIEAGFSPDRASEMIEANVVALKSTRKEHPMTMGSKDERNLRVFSFYEVDEYRNSEGKQAVYTGVSFTGSHSSTDYGFENVLEEFSTYLKSKNIQRSRPLLAEIVRPYKTDYQSRKYEDPELQKRWEKIQEKYGLYLRTETPAF